MAKQLQYTPTYFDITAYEMVNTGTQYVSEKKWNVPIKISVDLMSGKLDVSTGNKIKSVFAYLDNFRIPLFDKQNQFQFTLLDSSTIPIWFKLICKQNDILVNLYQQTVSKIACLWIRGLSKIQIILWIQMD